LSVPVFDKCLSSFGTTFSHSLKSAPDPPVFIVGAGPFGCILDANGIFGGAGTLWPWCIGGGAGGVSVPSGPALAMSGEDTLLPPFNIEPLLLNDGKEGATTLGPPVPSGGSCGGIIGIEPGPLERWLINSWSELLVGNADGAG